MCVTHFEIWCIFYFYFEGSFGGKPLQPRTLDFSDVLVPSQHERGWKRSSFSQSTVQPALSEVCIASILSISLFFFSLNLLWYVSKCTMSVVLSSTSLAFYWVVQRMSSLCFKVAGFLIALQGVVAFHEIYASALNCWHAMGFHWGLKKQKRTC